MRAVVMGGAEIGEKAKVLANSGHTALAAYGAMQLAALHIP
jgi:hypothetical protein